jgi:hypothetical protein
MSWKILPPLPYGMPFPDEERAKMPENMRHLCFAGKK